MRKKKKPEFLYSGKRGHNPDGSTRVSRVQNGKQIDYNLPPRKEKPKGRQAEACRNFGAICSQAYKEVRDPEKRALWEAQWRDYLTMMEEQGLEVKYHTLRGFVIGEMMAVSR